ncbi:hypothetical protein [Actinosynnema sp. NPDC020468]|uniref:hypothetical protein n=1 Tax=Actinosynnema sp. NPDC020468 TaxID=3154488 RepID=UPI003407BD8B
MDEKELAELFRDAAGDAPPASFDVGGIRTASARATARRRTAWVSGGALAVVLLLGGTVIVNTTSRESGTAGSAMEASSPNLSQSEMSPKIAQEPQFPATPDKTGGQPPNSIPEDPSTQGDESTGSADPKVGGASRACAEVDRELAAALADELPVVTTLPGPAAAVCPPGARGASYAVHDNGTYGTISAVLVPPGRQVLGGQSESRPTKAGWTIYVLSEPAAGESIAPRLTNLPAIAEALSQKF